MPLHACLCRARWCLCCMRAIAFASQLAMFSLHAPPCLALLVLGCRAGGVPESLDIFGGIWVYYDFKALQLPDSCHGLFFLSLQTTPSRNLTLGPKRARVVVDCKLTLSKARAIALMKVV
jgi:hypothetical protein